MKHIEAGCIVIFLSNLTTWDLVYVGHNLDRTSADVHYDYINRRTREADSESSVWGKTTLATINGPDFLILRGGV